MQTTTQAAATSARPTISSRATRWRAPRCARSDGEKIGTIERVMIEKRSGKVAYAVMSFGGSTGAGRGVHTPPWGVLEAQHAARRL